MRTEEEKKDMIAKLEASKANVPSHNAFGDPNHEIIDSQIDVIRGGLSEDGVYELEADLGEGNHMAALQTLWWLEGRETTEKFVEEMEL